MPEEPQRGVEPAGHRPADAQEGSTETQATPRMPAAIPKMIGRFHVKGVIASGGMGTVYRAVQEHPRRTVAVKVMKRGIASRSAMRRFEYESQILARLRHPGIAQVYEAGTHDDPGAPGEPVPFFAMEYIPNARPITEHAKEKKLGTRERLGLFAHVCDAVHHGHQKGIIHRDLKPGNILVDSHGEVKIIDFGVARGTDSDLAVTTLQTDIGQLIGTLQYMSPEQCEADPDDIDTRSDVYALGVVLYELVSGKLPYNVGRSQIYEATRTIREQEPTKLTTINKALRGDVETIVLKALEKDRDRRYQSSDELRRDIEHYLKGEPIAARPLSMVYQLRVFARRNKALVTGVVAVMLALTLGVIGTTIGLIHANRQRQVAANQAAKAEATLSFLQERLEAVDPSMTRGQEVTVRSMLDETARRLDDGEFAGQPEAEASVRGTLGKTYLGLGRYDMAERQLRAAETIQERELGEEHPETLRTRTALGEVLWENGKLEEAEQLLRATADSQQRLLGDDHRDTLLSTNKLAIAIGEQGRHGEAEDLYRRTLDIQRRVFGDEHPDTLKSMQDLSVLLGILGENTEKEKLLRQALEGRRRVLGDEHPETLRSMHTLGNSLRSQGKFAEAQTLLRRTLEIRRRVLGDDHRETSYSIGSLDNLLALRALTEPNEVRASMAELIALRGQLAQRPGANWGANDYAWLLLICEPPDLRDPETALSFAKKAVERAGREHLGTLILAQALDTLALAYQMTGDGDKAVETQREAARLLLPRVSASYETRLAAFLQEKGQNEVAESIIRKTVDQARTNHGEKHARLVRRMTDLALLLHARGRYLLHEHVCRQLDVVRQGIIPQHELGIADQVVYYAMALVEQEKYAEAEELLRYYVDIRKLAHGETDWRTAQVMSLLGASLSGQGKFAEAEPLLLDAYSQMNDNADTIPEYYRDDRIRKALKRVVNLYEAWDKPDQAAECRATLGNGE